MNLLMFLLVFIFFCEIYYVMMKIKEMIEVCGEVSVFLLIFWNKFILEKFEKLIGSLVDVLEILFLDFFDIFDEVRE